MNQEDLYKLKNTVELAEFERVLEEDKVVAKLLSDLEKKPLSSHIPTLESIKDGDLCMQESKNNSFKNINDMIDKGELITIQQLSKNLKKTVEDIRQATNDKKFFAIQTESGQEYYPNFYTDLSLNIESLAKVSQALENLQGSSKYHFFTSKHTALQATPLQALRLGRLEKVIAAAKGFLCN